MRIDLRVEEVEALRSALHGAAASVRLVQEEELLRAARRHLEEALGHQPLAFVAERLRALDGMIDMLADKDWVLPGTVRRRLLVLLAYFTDPHDLVPDATPAFGYLDDALLVEILREELHEELEGYADFRRLRTELQSRASGGDAPGAVEQALARHRKNLRARIQGRQLRRKERHASPLRRLLGRAWTRPGGVAR